MLALIRKTLSEPAKNAFSQLEAKNEIVFSIRCGFVSKCEHKKLPFFVKINGFSCFYSSIASVDRK